MTRLYRPHIPIATRCRVVLRQLGECFIDDCLKAYEGRLGALLTERLAHLATLLNCQVSDLHLDHDPALATRQRKGKGRRTIYTPAANDPEFLVYREKHAHHIKTNVRGDGAQYPDRVLIKRARQKSTGKNRRPHTRRRKFTWPKRKIPYTNRWPKAGFGRRGM